MNQSTRDVSLGVSDDRFPEGLHLCHVFNDDAERRRTIARYFSQGLKEGERALWLVDNVPPEEVRAQLAELGLDVAALAQRLIWSVSFCTGAFCVCAFSTMATICASTV